MRLQLQSNYLAIICLVSAVCSVSSEAEDIFVASKAEDTLRLVSLVYRHGDRSPVAVYPKDINQVDSWPDGLGWLSNIGKMQQYELGQFLKQRYDGFLNTSRYNHEEIYIESSAEDRCLMSAYSNLAGFFPPLEAQLWNPDIKWQPIPVQTRPEDEDNKLAQGAACPKYDKLFLEVLHSPAVQEEEKRNKEFYDMVERETGVKKETIADIWQVADTLICEEAHNLTWNDWVYEDDNWSKMLSLQRLSFDLMYATTEMARLKGGPLLKEIIANMQAASKSPTYLPKVYMYSAHDTTVAAVLSAMHMYNKIPPPYASAVMVELHEIDEEFVVKTFYKNLTYYDPFELFVKDCSYPCTLNEFIKRTNDSVPVDWDKECITENKSMLMTTGSRTTDYSLTAASWIAFVVGICLLVAIVGAVVVLAGRIRRNHRGVPYSTL